jgi:hypothetical protein
MLEITPDDISALNDADLRDLVGRLCEAELRNRGLSTASVRYGGNQDAKDSGIDVRISLGAKALVGGFIPRRVTGYQVKKPDLIPSKIAEEMRPRGKLRQAIHDLIKKRGAYVIVSSSASLSETAYGSRLKAMAAAIRRVKGAKALLLDFYDRKRLTTWLRDFPGLIPWVRSRAGRAIAGWQSYGPWAYPAEGNKAQYLLDEKVRIQTQAGPGLSAIEGIERIRDALRLPGSMVRIVGLSGVGKTRLVQALFDERVGATSLDPSRAFYTNLSDDPDPQPIGFASDLIASKTPAVLVVDNCPPDLHRRLTEVCRQVGSKISTVTVEYDIRSDEPEDTDVFRIEPSSEILLEKLIEERFKSVSPVDAKTIATFSGGNARIAIALAGTVDKNDKLTGLTDEDLFKRLFQQRHEHDADLLLIAQACSLVYSFEAETVEGPEAELPIFAALTGKTVQQFHAGIAELERRDLIQRRSVWRAVLPHAIANRLAKIALQNIPRASIDASLLTRGRERLLKSYSRRLGYLHDSGEAVRVVEGWFAPDGLLADLTNLNDMGHALLQNIAPVAPAILLGALKRADPEKFSGRDKIAILVRSVAYDVTYFDECAELLVRLANINSQNGTKNEATSCLVSLFYPYLSGTRAPLEQRWKILEALLLSADPVRQNVGLEALDAALETYHFSSSYNFDFGSHSRDFGWQPETWGDVRKWYGSFLSLLDQVRRKSPALAEKLKKILASNFRGLYSRGRVGEELHSLCEEIAKEGFWRDGWVAVRQMLAFDTEMPPEIRAKIETLGKTLRPRGLREQIKAIVLGNSSSALDLDDDFDLDEDENPASAYRRHETIAEALGKQAADSDEDLAFLAPELVRAHGRTWHFGRGLAQNASAPKEIWDTLLAQLQAVPPPEQRIQIFRGFLNGLHEINPDLVDHLCDEALSDPMLGSAFPALQSSVPLTKKGLGRLFKSLDLGLASAQDFRVLRVDGPNDVISAADLRDLLLAISAKPDGNEVGLELLSFLIWDPKHEKTIAFELKEAGRMLLQRVRFKRHASGYDYTLAEIVRASFSDREETTLFLAVCSNFKEAVDRHEIYDFDYDDFLQSLFTARPLEALDAFFGNSAHEKLNLRYLVEEIGHRQNPLANISGEKLVEWCGREPEFRYPTIASIIPMFSNHKENSSSGWSTLALEILRHAPNKLSVLERFVGRFRPMSWSGSRAAIMESRLPMLAELESYPDADVAQYGREQGIVLKEEIVRERERETKHDRNTDERFE